MKTFKTLMGEAAAADYIGKPADDEEATRKKKYRSKGEQDFADQHAVVKSDHPVATDAQFASSEIPSNVHKGFEQGKSGEMEVVTQGNSPKSFKEAFAVEESVELTEANVVDTLKDIVKTKGAKTVKFDNNKTLKVDMTTASMLLSVHDNLNSANAKKFRDQLEKGPNSFMKMVDFAFSVGK